MLPVPSVLKGNPQREAEEEPGSSRRFWRQRKHPVTGPAHQPPAAGPAGRNRAARAADAAPLRARSPAGEATIPWCAGIPRSLNQKHL